MADRPTGGERDRAEHDSTGERVDTTRLQHMARAYTQSTILWAALDLDLFTHVAAGAGDLDAIAGACGITKLNADRLVTCCLALGLLDKDADGRLSNPADVAKFLVKDRSRYAGPWMNFTRPDVAGWMRLGEILASPAPPSRLGMYSDLTVDAARSYHRATASVGRGAGRRFARHVDMSGRHRLLDLGGGSGAYSIEAVLAYPDMTAVVFDLPPVAVVCREFLEAAGVADRVDAAGGDFTADDLPGGCDIAVMASNLPIYDEATIGRVVAKTYEALEPGGEMHLVGETLDDDGIGPLDAALWGMQEALYGSGGKAHTRAQVVGYFRDAGFVDVGTVEFVPGVLQRISGRKPA